MNTISRKLRVIIAALAVVLLLSLAPAGVLAQQDAADPDPQETAVNDGPEANLPYLFAAYTVTWIGFFAYLYYLSQRQRSLRREVEMLREALEERDRRDREAG